MKHSIRILALLLAVLLVVLPPLQARAAIGTGTGILIGLAATAVVGSVLAGLGVMPGSDRSVFDGLVDDCIASDAVSPFLDGDGLIQVLRYTNGIGNVRYGVLRNLIEAVRSWLFEEQVVSLPSPYIPNGGSFSVNGEVYSVDGKYTAVFAYYTSSGSFYITVFSSLIEGGSVYDSSGTKLTFSSQVSNISGTVSTTWYDRDLYSGTPISFVPTYRFGSLSYKEGVSAVLNGSLSPIDNSFSSSYDVSLGDVASEDSDLAVAYSDWSAGSIALPHPGIDIPGTDEGTDEGTGEDTGEDTGEEEGEKKLVYWPTGIGGSLTDVGSDATTGALTQEGVISGVGTLDDTLTGALPGTIVGGITGDIAIDDTQIGEGTDEGTGEGEITYPTDIPSYTLDLTDIFPFCIPFDIYEFLSILAAEPEAPVFHWKVPVPQLGTEYEVEVDLSPWDNVAKLFRTLELLAFIVGLAMMTRDKFIRS